MGRGQGQQQSDVATRGFAQLPEMAVYLDDKRGPFISEWEWLTTLDAFTERMCRGDVEHVSLDYNLECTDPKHNGLDAIRWMSETGNWPSASIQLHTGDYDGRDEMAALIAASGIFCDPEEHPIGHIYRRRA